MSCLHLNSNRDQSINKHLQDRALPCIVFPSVTSGKRVEEEHEVQWKDSRNKEIFLWRWMDWPFCHPGFSELACLQCSFLMYDGPCHFSSSYQPRPQCDTHTQQGESCSLKGFDCAVSLEMQSKYHKLSYFHVHYWLMVMPLKFHCVFKCNEWLGGVSTVVTPSPSPYFFLTL